MHNLDVCSILLEVTVILFLLVQMLSDTKKIKPFVIITRRLLYSYNFYIYYNSAGIEVSLYFTTSSSLYNDNICTYIKNVL